METLWWPTTFMIPTATRPCPGAGAPQVRGDAARAKAAATLASIGGRAVIGRTRFPRLARRALESFPKSQSRARRNRGVDADKHGAACNGATGLNASRHTTANERTAPKRVTRSIPRSDAGFNGTSSRTSAADSPRGGRASHRAGRLRAYRRRRGSSALSRAGRRPPRRQARAVSAILGVPGDQSRDVFASARTPKISADAGERWFHSPMK